MVSGKDHEIPATILAQAESAEFIPVSGGWWWQCATCGRCCDVTGADCGPHVNLMEIAINTILDCP